MLPSLIVEPLHVIERQCARLVAGGVHPAVGALDFERGEEALHGRVVPDVALATHGAGDVVRREQALERLARVPAALVGVMQQRLRLAAAPNAISRASVASSAVMELAAPQRPYDFPER
jgi:hypothetical protein